MSIFRDSRAALLTFENISISVSQSAMRFSHYFWKQTRLTCAQTVFLSGSLKFCLKRSVWVGIYVAALSFRAYRDLRWSNQYLECQQKLTHLTYGAGLRTQIHSSYVRPVKIYY